jgi:class 3 adenylate cyclase
MQRVLESDRISRPGEEQIHIKVGLHTGPCIVQDKDVYGDVVNVASRVQNQTEPDQILITEDLLEAAKLIGPPVRPDGSIRTCEAGLSPSIYMQWHGPPPPTTSCSMKSRRSSKKN